MIHQDKGTVKLLDCTLRDGGQGLEAINKNYTKTKVFSDEEKIKIIEYAKKADFDIIEIGCISHVSPANPEMAIYPSIETLSEFLPKEKNAAQLYTGLFIGPDTPLNSIPDASENLVEGTRLILRYSELQKSIDYCRGLAKKGYKVFMQPMLTMRYTDDELSKIIDAANEMKAYALYIVDSYGYMTEKDLERLYRFYDERLDKDIHIGFHAHNNMSNAFMNAKYFIEKLVSRDCIVDACAMGMGQGAGNLQTEIIANYLNEKYDALYDFTQILEICEILDAFRIHDKETWGYSTLNFISARHRAAYKYASEMRYNRKMSFSEIDKVFDKMPYDLKQRYTKESLEKVLNLE